MDGAFWTNFRTSPALDRAILGAARALVEGEGLGRGPATDLLALGLSATDYVGHTYGNGGPEMEDQVRRLDRELGAFLDDLRAKVPGVWVVLTADHGARDFPERLQARGVPARRLYPREWLKGLNQELIHRLGGDRNYFRSAIGQQLYLDPEALRKSGRSREEVLKAAAEAAKATPEVDAAFTADELAAFTPDPAEAPDKRSYRARLRLSYVPGRSGDLLVAFKPIYSLDDPNHVADHGQPHDYDRRVPLVFWGPWKSERRTEPVRVVDLAPTLAGALGLVPTDQVDGHPLPLHLQ
jgi:arylsulfatase A-like enzyme